MKRLKFWIWFIFMASTFGSTDPLSSKFFVGTVHCCKICNYLLGDSNYPGKGLGDRGGPINVCKKFLSFFLCNLFTWSLHTNLARVLVIAAGQSPSVSRPAAAPILWFTSRAARWWWWCWSPLVKGQYLFYLWELFLPLESQGEPPIMMASTLRNNSRQPFKVHIDYDLSLLTLEPDSWPIGHF